MKRNILYIFIIVIFLLVIGIIVYITNKDEINYKTDKSILLQNITYDNESILTSGNNITIIVDIKNNNTEVVKLKKVNVTLINDYNEEVKKFDVKVNKKIKANSSIKIKKTVKIKNTQSRVFTKYKFEI